MDVLLFSLLFASIGLVLALLAKAADKRILVAAAALFAVYLALDDLTTGLPHLAGAFDFIPGSWNWAARNGR